LDAVDESAMDDLLGHSITYRIAFGPQAGRKAFALQTVPAPEDGNNNPRLAGANGFSLHAGVVAQAHQRRKLERLCRYIARPAISTERMALTNQGYIRYTLKTPYRDGTGHIIPEPLDCTCSPQYFAMSAMSILVLPWFSRPFRIVLK
jgi:hypothetical protein